MQIWYIAFVAQDIVRSFFFKTVSSDAIKVEIFSNELMLYASFLLVETGSFFLLFGKLIEVSCP